MKNKILKSLIFLGLLLIPALCRAEESDLSGLIEAAPFDPNLVAKIDAAASGVSIAPGLTGSHKDRLIYFEKVVKKCLQEARLSAGLDQYGNYHSCLISCLNVLAVILGIILAAIASSNSNGGGHTSYNYHYHASSSVSTPEEESQYHDITNCAPSVVASVEVITLFVVFICSWVRYARLRTAHLGSGGNLWDGPDYADKVFVPTFITFLGLFLAFFPAWFITSKIFNWIKNRAVRNAENNFDQNVESSAKSLLRLSGSPIAVVSKIPDVNVQLNKLFANDVSMDQRVKLFALREQKHYFPLLVKHLRELAQAIMKDWKNGPVRA